MDTVSYPDSKVTDFIPNNVIPLRVPFDSEPLASNFNIKWTPTLIIVDWKGVEHHRTVGFLPPEELIPSILLGIAKVYYELDQFPAAIQALERVADTYPKSGAAPEAVFLTGVCKYKNTHDPKYLKQAYEKLSKEYNDSEWAKRALPYRLIP